MSTTIGIDYSGVGGALPDLVEAKNAGARFVALRGAYGRSVGTGTPIYLDPVWTRDADKIVRAGLKRAAYLFLCYPSADHKVTPTPEEQVDAFAAYVRLNPHHDFVPFVDVEEQSTLNAFDYYAWTMRAVTRMRDHYGAWPGVYTSQRVWHEHLKDHVVGDLANCPPWIAKPWPHPVHTPVDMTGALAYAPNVPALGIGNWWLYQYQGDGTGWPGISRTVDVNRFNVTRAGAVGAHVAWMQKRLGVPVTGVYDGVTGQALRVTQASFGLVADGVVGPDTFAAISWMMPR